MGLGGVDTAARGFSAQDLQGWGSDQASNGAVSCHLCSRPGRLDPPWSQVVAFLDRLASLRTLKPLHRTTARTLDRTYGFSTARLGSGGRDMTVHA